MVVIKDVVSSFSFFPVRDDDDFVDRLHYFITTNILLALTVLVSFKQFGSDPIDCMIPDLFPGSWEAYIENYCWAQGTYYLPKDLKVVPARLSERYEQHISYYQWVPFLLVFQAVCFCLPAMFWGMFNVSSGINITSIVEMAREDTNIRPEIRKNTIHILASHMENSLKFHRRMSRREIMPHKYLRCLNLTYMPSYMTMTYLFTKCLYLANVVLQWEFMRWFLGTNHLQHWSTLVNGTEWHNTGLFPRVTLCDFEYRMMGSNVNRQTLQCLLLINLFNEKIFIFMYFWFFAIGLITAFSLIYWFWILYVPPFSKRYVIRHLQLGVQPVSKAKDDREMLDKFIDHYLNRDGVFALRMVSLHIGVIFATDLVWCLWRRYYGIDDEFIRFTEPALPPQPPPDADEEPEAGNANLGRKHSVWRHHSLEHLNRDQFDPAEDAHSEGSSTTPDDSPLHAAPPATAPVTTLDTVDTAATFAATKPSAPAKLAPIVQGDSGSDSSGPDGLDDPADWASKKKQQRDMQKQSSSYGQSTSRSGGSSGRAAGDCYRRSGQHSRQRRN